MKFSLIVSIVTLLIVSLTACNNWGGSSDVQPVSSVIETSQRETVIEKMEVEILSVKNEKDGNVLELKNNDGEVFVSVISIPNLGPDSDFDFTELKIGNRLLVSGELWEMDGVKRLTVRDVETIAGDGEASKQQACESRGGKYEIGGKAQVQFCNEKSKDEGKNCSDSSECDGLCLDAGSGVGKCSEYQTNFGCIDVVEGGKAVTICID